MEGGQLYQPIIGRKRKGFSNTGDFKFLEKGFAVELDCVFETEELLADFFRSEALGGKREDLLLFWLEYYRFACMPAMVGKVIFLVAALSKNAKVDVSWFFAGGKGYRT